MRVAFYTLGCKVNQYESAALMEDFLSAGFMLVGHSQEADVYVLNSCTVTGEADKKSRQLLRRFRRQNPNAIIALCGCFPQAFPEDSLTSSEADIVLGTTNKQELLSSVKEYLLTGQRLIRIKEHTAQDKFQSVSVSSFSGKTRAFVKIQDGCERFCAYCIIPFARGSVRSKSLDNLKAELEVLAENGYKEVVLVGINLSCYGTDFGGELLDAINLACSIDGILRVRLGSLEPELLSDDTINKMSRQPKLCPQFHLSLQSGSDATLKRMRRHYTTKDYTQIVSSLRGAFDNCAITTDIMVGFPGETQAEFAQSLAFAKKIGLAKAHVFSYSQRGGTDADQMPNQIEQFEKVRRNREMIKITKEARAAFLEAQVGRVEEVIFEAKSPRGWEGYTRNYTTVLMNNSNDIGKELHRELHKVKITSHNGDYCFGFIL